MTDQPYLPADKAHAEGDALLQAQLGRLRDEDREWSRSLAVEQRAADILADPRELDISVGDNVYGCEPFEPGAFINARSRLATAKTNADIMAAAIEFQDMLKRIATAQAEREIK